MAGYYEGNYESKGSILAHPDGYSAFPQTVSSTDPAVVTENGVKVLKGGTVYPANDATARGIVLQDYPIDADGNAQAAIVYIGDIKGTALIEGLTDEAKSALTGIHVFGTSPAAPSQA